MKRFAQLYRKIMPLAVTGAVVMSLAQSASAAPGYASRDEEIHGRISEFLGKYHITVRDDQGYVDDVSMHQGTVINPIGLTLSQGMRVTIYGHGDGDTFEADEIDTPYHHAGYAYPYPTYPVYPVYPGYGYGYGYGAYGPGPYYSGTVIINGGGGWHGGGWRR